jgi:hypothetical protein
MKGDGGEGVIGGLAPAVSAAASSVLMYVRSKIWLDAERQAAVAKIGFTAGVADVGSCLHLFSFSGFWDCRSFGCLRGFVSTALAVRGICSQRQSHHAPAAVPCAGVLRAAHPAVACLGLG